MDISPPLRVVPSRSRAGGKRGRVTGAGLRRTLCGAVLLASSGSALAFTVALTATAPKTAYLQVGVGTFTSGAGNCPYNGTQFCYSAGGQPQKNTTINTVSVALAANAVGTGAQPMTTNSVAANSFYDGYTFCTVPGQLYIGGFYRTASGTSGAATVTATVPAALTNAAGDSIPFSKISWTSTGLGDTGTPPEPFPAGSFVNGGVQTVGSMGANSWNESCLVFSYLNNTVPPAGTFTGVVLYTLSTP